MHRALVVAVALLTVLAVLPAPASAHVNHAAVDSQVSSDGTVLVENAYAATDAVIVLHRLGPDGAVGPAIGERALRPADGPLDGFEITIDPAVWEGWTTGRVVAIVYADRNENGAYDPGTDTELSAFGEPARDEFTLAAGPDAAVVGQGFTPRKVTDGRVEVIRVDLGTDGFLVVRGRTDGEPGPVIGTTALGPGTHENVTVALSADSLASKGPRFDLYAQVYRDDGDGVFEPDEDAPAMAGDDPVMTRFTASQQNGSVTATADGGGDPQLNTPTPTATTTTSTTGVTAPGFGLALALLAVGTAALLGRRGWP